MISWSKYVDDVARQLESDVPGWGEMVRRASIFLRKGDEIGKRMEVVGEEGTSLSDMIIHLKAELYDFCYLQQNAFDKVDAYCPLERQIPLFRLINHIFETPFDFPTRDKAREFFLTLQGKIKSLNSIPFATDGYKHALAVIQEMIETARKI